MSRHFSPYSQFKIPFNRPHFTRKELDYISHAHALGQLSGDGYYTRKCHEWLEKKTGTAKALLTTSCTDALEMMAIIVNLQKGDEVIMPSFNFTSSANAVVLRGATPVFVDIRSDTLNINETLVESAITPHTKALYVVHYAGVSCEMDTIKNICAQHNLLLFEDAAQGILATYKGKPLGTLGDMGAYSFHETKNVIAGEGGVLLLNKKQYIKRAEFIREKGTNRTQFFKGKVDKYTWDYVGSSYLPGEVIAAFLLAQLEQAKEITNKRIRIWNKYHKAFEGLEKAGYLIRPSIPREVSHNGHIYYILVNNKNTQEKLLKHLHSHGILATSHYVPLHSSPAGKKFGRFVGPMGVTTTVSSTLIRMPLFYDLTQKEIDYIVKTVNNFFK